MRRTLYKCVLGEEKISKNLSLYCLNFIENWLSCVESLKLHRSSGKQLQVYSTKSRVYAKAFQQPADDHGCPLGTA